MAIYLPPTAEEEQLALDDLTPREIVAELDKYVVGQKDANRAVAIALRNRMRRLKVEASKFTEVGYVGRDVESMIRDLVEIAIDMIRGEKLEDVADKAELNAEERLLDLLLPPSAPRAQEPSSGGGVIEASVGG